MCMHTFRTELLAPRAREPGLALALTIHRIASGVVVAVAFVSAIRAESAWKTKSIEIFLLALKGSSFFTHRTRLTTIRSHPTTGASAFSGDVVTLSAVFAVTPAQASSAEGAQRAGVLAEETGVAGFAFALPGQVVARAVARGAGRAGLFAVDAVEALKRTRVTSVCTNPTKFRVNVVEFVQKWSLSN